MSKNVWSIDVPYACFGIVEIGGVVTEAAPIAKWCVGKPWRTVRNYYEKRKAAKVILAASYD